MMRRLALSALAVLLLGTAGCAVFSQRITTRRQFEDVRADRPITVFAREDRLYRLDRHTLRESAIWGTGVVQERGGARATFEGEIPLDQVVAVRTTSPQALRRIAFVGVTAVLAVYASEMKGTTGLKPSAEVTYHGPPVSGGGETSCPYVYAWDGARWALQAEPFGVGWGRALELTTRHLLTAARAEDGVVSLRLANERRETHYVNSVALQAVHLGSAPAAVLDGEGTAWPLADPVPPLAARDRSGRDVLPWVASADDRSWECDPSDLTAESGYEDVLELAFARRGGVSEVSLVVTGINTALSAAVYARLCGIMGDETALMAHAIESDPELVERLREYRRDASLRAFVREEGGWRPAGALLPEASAVPFTRALRIRVPAGAGDTVRVLLRAMADVWRLDAISADWSEARPLATTPLRLLSAVGPSGEDLRGILAADDGRRAILLPPERVELRFAAAASKPGDRVVYALAARGYLHEWETSAEQALATPAGLPSGQARIELLKQMLADRRLALAPVYEDWRRARAR